MTNKSFLTPFKKIGKRLSVLLVTPVLFGCASSFEVGPSQGGRCSGSDMYCVAYIQEITPGGGKVVSITRGAVWTGRPDFVRETQSITNQNCLSRGFTRANLSGPINLPDQWIYRQIREFTCVKDAPSPSILPQRLPLDPPQVQSKPQGTPNAAPSASIDQAREKCKDLGFKEKTEAFGTCVLKLSN